MLKLFKRKNKIKQNTPVLAKAIIKFACINGHDQYEYLGLKPLNFTK